MRRVVITADDVGIVPETSLAAEIAHREGVLTSVSVMANMPAFSCAVAMARRNAHLGIGVHLVLTSGRPVLPPRRVPLLVDSAGMFRHGYGALVGLVLGPNRSAVLRQMRDELSAQLDRALSSGLDIDHLDGHRHVHMIPAIWPLVRALATECGNLPVRVVDERPEWIQRRRMAANLAKTVFLGICARANQASMAEPIHFAGLMDSGCVNVRVLRRLLRNLPTGTGEIATHPSLALSPETTLTCSAEDKVFMRSRSRASEFAALLNPKVREILAAEQVELVTFRALRRAARPQSAALAATC